MITLTLPWPPTSNTLYPSSRTGRRFLSERGKRYIEQIRVALVEQLSSGHRAIAGRIGYRVRMMAPDRQRRDLSNHLKAIEDCLTKCGLWGDDSQVDDGHFTRGPIVKGGRVEIEIWQIVEPKEAT